MDWCVVCGLAGDDVGLEAALNDVGRNGGVEHRIEAGLVLRQVLAQRRVALGGAVLQRHRPLGLQHAVTGGFEALNREDVGSGQAAGARSILLRSGHGARDEELHRADITADAILNNLMEAVGWILRNSPH